jgi:hypothetical protein
MELENYLQTGGGSSLGEKESLHTADNASEVVPM